MTMTIAPNPAGHPVGGMTGQLAGHLKYVFVDVTFDSSLLSAGETLTPAHVGLTTIFGVIEAGANAPVGVIFTSTSAY